MNQTITKNGHSLPRTEYCSLKALEAQERFPKDEFTPDIIEKMVWACENEQENWLEESTHNQDVVMGEVCDDLLDSNNAPAQELEVVTEQQWSPNNQEAAMIEACRTSSIESGAFSELRQVFDFDCGMRRLVVKEGAIVTPILLSKVIGVGHQMSEAGRFLIADAAMQLQAMGRYDEVLDQMEGMLSLSYSAFSNWCRTAKRISGPLAPYRESLPFAVCQEIACAKYSADEEENITKVGELLKEAEVNAWTVEQARAQVKLKQGKPPKESKKENSPQYVCILNGEYFLTNDQPPIEPGLIMIDMKNLECLVDDGSKVSMQPIPVR